MTNQSEVTYNTIPHYVARHFRSGDLTLNEMRVLLWLRAIGTPYGIATTSLDDLHNDVLPEYKKNTANTILLSLRQKQFIFYEFRQGKNGSFDIELNHWKMPNKHYKTLDKFFVEPRQWTDERSESGHSTAYPHAEPSEASQKSGVSNQKLDEQRKRLVQQFSADSRGSQIRSSHTDTETEHEIENHDKTLGIYEGGTLVRKFEPRTYEETLCLNIAREVGETYMNPILSVLRKDGLRIIERAWGLFKEDRERDKRIDKPPQYFFGIIKKLRDSHE